MPTRSVITIGNFDGVHAGHAALIRRAHELANLANLANPAPPPTRVIAVTFDPHPLTVLKPGAEPARITTFDRKAALLRALGAAEVVRLTPDDATLNSSPEQFVDRLVREYAPVAFVEGPDFRFGRARAGDIRTLAALGTARDPQSRFRVEVVEPVQVALCDHTLVTASSNLVRWMLEHGRVRDAASLLGRPHVIDGLVERGERRGRTIGWSTANLRAETIAPGDGVYAGIARLEDGRRFPAAISIGTKPTFGDRERAVEAVLLDANHPRPVTLPGLPEYGWRLSLHLLGWIRDQVRFASVADLTDQIARDAVRALAITSESDQAAAPAARAERASA
ncbi:MAG: bifunctional riboflavin kinase/FMN adenylyltransferase [Phycisphaerales bacterium]